MTLTNWISIIAIIVTTAGVIISLCNSNRQINNSNKQSLFDRRLNIFLISEKFSDILKQMNFSNDVKKDKDDFIIMYTLNFREMINTVSLNKLWKVIPNPIDINSSSTVHDDKVKNEFLETKVKFFNIAKEAEFVFKSPENKIISKFITDYINLLDGYRLYDVIDKYFNKSENTYRYLTSNSQITHQEYLIKKRPEIFHYQEKYILTPANDLLTSFNKYKEHLKKIENQIKI